MSYSEDLRSRLVDGIKELEADIERLQAAISALDNGAPVSHASPTPTAPRRRSRRRTNQGTVVVPAGKIASLLQSTDGITTAELARQTNGGHEQILSILKELEADGKAHRSGTRRSTKWHAGPASSNGASTAADIPAAAGA